MSIPASVICASTCASAPAKLRPITLKRRGAYLRSAIMALQLNTPPPSESQNPGLKNVPSTKLPTQMRITVTAQALREPSAYNASKVARFASPGLAHGSGRGKAASKRNITSPNAANNAVRVMRCDWGAASKSDRIDLVLFFSHEQHRKMIGRTDEHVLWTRNRALFDAVLVRARAGQYANLARGNCQGDEAERAPNRYRVCVLQSKLGNDFVANEHMCLCGFLACRAQAL